MRADARANRSALIEAARRLYATKGPDLPFGAIAEEAGVGIGTLYRHFPTQSDLVVGLIHELRDEVREIARTWREPMATDPHGSWRGFVDAVVGLRVATFMPQVIEGSDAETVVPLGAEARAAALEELGSVLDLAKDAGLVDPAVTAGEFQIGLAIITRPLPAVTAGFIPDTSEWLVDVYLRGIHPSAG